MRMHVQHHILAAFHQGRRPGAYSTEGWLVSGSVWTSVECLFPLGFEPKPVHLIASCLTDYTLSVTLHLCRVIILIDSWHLIFPCSLVYDTYRTHSPYTHTWKEVTDVSCQIELGLWVCYIGRMVCLQYRCTKPCARKNVGCKEDHMCTKKCYKECGACMIRVERKLPNCGHYSRMYCYMDPETYPCWRNCDRILPCRHPCRNICYEKCGNCPVKVSSKS